MFSSLDALREPLLAARLLREEILVAPVPPSRRAALRATIRAAGTTGAAPPAALDAAARLGSEPGFLAIRRSSLDELAALCGGASLRASAGEVFHGRPAPAASEVPGLLGELLDTVNAPRAVEAWSPVVRAFALHFTLRLVQPFAAPPAAVSQAAEVMVLASDGFDPSRMCLPGIAGPGRERTRPDADAFARERADALVDGLGRTLGRLRDEAARALLRGWAGERASRLNDRQRAALDWLGEPGRTLDFRAYVTLNAARGRPGLRSLQRDWRALREAGWVAEAADGVFVLSTEPLEWGAAER